MKESLIQVSGIKGALYRPSQILETLPGIILISGSEGGIPGANAIPKSFIEELVNNKFIVLALAYFGIPGLPQHLQNIDLVYFEAAFRWFQSCSNVNKDAISIIGQSRGAELALIFGGLSNQIKSIVACAPSSIITGGFPFPNQPAWQYKGCVLTPYLGSLTANDFNLTELNDLKKATQDKLIPFHANTEQDPFIIADLFAARNLTAHAKLSEIHVEKLTCPILLFSGGQDAIWASTYYCQSIINRLKQHNSQISYNHINYENAGHGLMASYEGPIYHPVGKFWCKLGGTADGNKTANQDSLKQTINFLLSQ